MNASFSRRFWVLAALIFLSLAYSASLHTVYGPVSTISLEFWQGSEPPHPLRAAFPSQGAWETAVPAHEGPDAWKLTSFWVDGGYYLLQTESLTDSIPPYRYRVLPTAVVALLTHLIPLPPATHFALLNLLLTLLTALVFTWFLGDYFRFSPLLALLGGVLFMTMVATTRTLPFPMLDPAAHFLALLLVIAVARRSAALFLLTAVAGVLTKETLLFGCIMWVVENWGESWGRRWRATAVAILPILLFMGVRAALGGSPLEVNYGFDLLRGEFPGYGRRLFDLYELLKLGLELFLTFSFLWLGLLNLPRHPFLRRHAVIIPLTVLTAVLLSGRIARVLGVLFPLIIPAFLLFFPPLLAQWREREEGVTR